LLLLLVLVFVAAIVDVVASVAAVDIGFVGV